MVRGAWAAVVVSCALGGVARGEENAPSEPVASTTLPAPAPVAMAEPAASPVIPEPRPAPDRAEDEDAEEEARADPAVPQVRVKGRVLARAGADQRNDFEREVGIAQARVGVEATYGFAEAVIEAELSSQNLLRDAYLRINAGERLRFYGGQFKAPFLQRQLESTWDLPRVGRGLVEDYLIETHQLGGRRLGVMAELKLPWLRGLKVEGGVFQGARALDESVMGEDASLRIQAKPLKGTRVGVNGYAAEFLDDIQRYAVAGDATVTLGRLSLTGEAGLGRVLPGRFTSQSLIATYDVNVARSGWVIQPMVSGEALQLRADQVGYGWGTAVGLNALLDDRVKLTLQLQRAQRADDDRPANDAAFQVGARF